ncbi:hypothetical protein BGZ63DRAFT_403464 [Mariannaea sp. PMI_226]|nr:hypothetical protein BGZ63DRAFT_403464 [Mariannaea sp. PMI_226]
MALPADRPNVTSAFALPSIKLVLVKEKLEVNVTSSICLDLPPQLLSIETVTQLADLVRQSHLWICRRGPCCFEVSVTINSNPIQEQNLIEEFSRLILKSELWDRLCLRLELECHAISQLPGVMTFSIHHPDLASALLPPTSALTSRFHAALVSINVVEARKKLPSDESPPKPPKKRKRKLQDKSKVKSPTINCEKLCSSLEVDDQLAVESFMASLNFTSRDCLDQLATNPSTDCIRPTLEVSAILRSLCLIDSIFEMLLLSPQKKYKGIRVFGDISATCLTSLAPGVFHMPYLKSLSDRSEFIKVIGSSLARMKNAESPLLRQKIRELYLGRAPACMITNEGNMIARAIENHAWNVLLSHSEIPPLNGRGTRMRRATPQVGALSSAQGDTAGSSAQYLIIGNNETYMPSLAVDEGFSESQPVTCSFGLETLAGGSPARIHLE